MGEYPPAKGARFDPKITERLEAIGRKKRWIISDVLKFIVEDWMVNRGLLDDGRRLEFYPEELNDIKNEIDSKDVKKKKTANSKV